MVRAALPSIPVVNLLPGIRKTGGEMSGLSRTGTATTERTASVSFYANETAGNGVTAFDVDDVTFTLS